MNRIKQYFSKFTLDSYVIFITSLIAGIISILDFFNIANVFVQQHSAAIVVGTASILLFTMLGLIHQSRSDMEQLKNAIGIVEADILNGNDQYTPNITKDTLSVKNIMATTFLTWELPNPDYHSLASTEKHVYSDYHRILYRRISREKIVHNYVVSIWHRQCLEEIIFLLVLYKQKRYFVRHYEPSPKAIPLLNFRSFDDEIFYLGGFDPYSSQRVQQIRLRQGKFKEFFKYYWATLWENSIPLNQGRHINWDELKRIADRLDVPEMEFETIVQRAEEQAKTIKQTL